MSHDVDGLIGSMTHHNPYNQPPPIYGAPQYPQHYGGPSYYPLSAYQKLFHVVPHQPLGGPPLVTHMHLVPQSSMGPPPTPTYNHNSCGGTSTSYTPYGSTLQNNLYFPFPGPPQPIYPPKGHPHVDVNFVHPSRIQQIHEFKKLNAKNPTHQLNNAKNKGKNLNNNNPGPGGNNPQHNHTTRGNQNQGNQNPQGDNNNKQQGKNNKNLRTNFPWALCFEYGHYTHHFPQIYDFKWMKESMNPPCPLALPTPQ
jgi:hypothetical protein